MAETGPGRGCLVPLAEAAKASGRTVDDLLADLAAGDLTRFHIGGRICVDLAELGPGTKP